MQNLIASSTSRAIIGAGLTGRSMVRCLQREGLDFDWFDTRPALDDLEQIQAETGAVPQLGDLDPDQLSNYDELLLSPGVPASLPVLQKAAEQGARISGDVDLFARRAKAPIAAITGSNGKSTVTALLAHLAAEQGRKVTAAGNIGLPVLDLLAQPWDLYVLELSSFQLETTRDLGARVAAILNISPDHMDRYPDMLSYHQAKQRIYQGAQHLVCNREDPLTMPLLAEGQTYVTFGLSDPDLGQYGIRTRGGRCGLFKGMDLLLYADELKLAGMHNMANVLAALAMAEELGLDLASSISSLKQWSGLPHRCQLVSQHGGIQWVNDSKATNLGATIAAVEGLAGDSGLILIAGGQGKQQDFSGFAAHLKGKVRQVFLIGEMASELYRELTPDIAATCCDSLEAAVKAAKDCAVSGETVLLSPACASFDMFSGYAERGETFARLAGGAI